MAKVYEDLTPEEQNKLSYAWLDVHKGLEVYSRILGVDQLDDMVNSFIWDTAKFEKEVGPQ